MLSDLGGMGHPVRVKSLGFSEGLGFRVWDVWGLEFWVAVPNTRNEWAYLGLS